MPISFRLNQPIGGFALVSAKPGDPMEVISQEIIGPKEAQYLQERLERLDESMFHQIPGLPPPWQIHHLLIVIKRNLEGVAYVNELRSKSEIKANRPISAGEQVYSCDIDDILSVSFDVDIPNDAAVVRVVSAGWKRSLFYDLDPLNHGSSDRGYSLAQTFAKQELQLLGIRPSSGDGVLKGVDFMNAGLERLRDLLNSRNSSESAYQELLAEHSWMLGGNYTELKRHTKLDESNIPDFTAIRCSDFQMDIVEIKQPFLKLFNASGSFSKDFDNAWSQAERYLLFVQDNREYIRNKGFNYGNPKCLLIVGYEASMEEMRRIIGRERMSSSIAVVTYDRLIGIAEQIVKVARTAGRTLG